MTTDTRAFVNFHEVQKSYDGSSLVVKSLSLAIARGEFLTMLGPSGSGKTTSLMMLAGFERPTSGKITVAGRDLTNLPPHRRDIGMVFQNYALFPHMTIEENVAFPLVARKIPKPEIATRVTGALERIRMGAFAQRRPAQLSGGQQQRVALARALVFEPSLVLMDEPLGALDKQLREHMQMEIKHLHEELGLTVVYVTHDQDEALAMSDRVAVFNNGIIEQVGPARAIYESPETAFVSSFVGENNQLSGVVSAIALELCTVTIGTVKAECRTVGSLKSGDRVVVSLRPERVCLVHDSGVYANSVKAIAKEVVYFGDHLRVSCQLEDGQTVTMKQPNRGGIPQTSVGESVLLGWQATDARALASEGVPGNG
ncbi:spermidine/putrescine ABC transporter ATP-binding subunit [Rhizobium leguminosarum bv. trifolii WSM2297]|uniref:Spermidine/putrescine import ATP-binding protein PotA n=1 Tax=Rhizobium leguminosarum bv. trifolii WSM2297 TaxID=754762 RepID=J0W6D9_RHILT|nr:ABC transporter ATP-binding protein [Rhizobium leguminosarum]EJC80703.1 spermidine/putrescine ABC transporter ATP-binding subunit [Rhizobium leguminosarum bv. trifolii WSM2297]